MKNCLSAISRISPLIALCFVCIGMVTPARAVVIFSDSFSGTAGTTLASRQIESSVVEGAQWVARPLFPTYPLVLDTASSQSVLKIQRNGAAFVSIASSGSYNKPDTITLSASLSIQTMQLTGLGYWSSTASVGNVDSIDNFVGFYINATGQLRFIEKTTSTDIQIGAAIASFSTTAYYTISYTINTGTGTLSSLTVGGVDYTEAFNSSSVAGTGVFSDTATHYAGVFGRNTASSSAVSYADNFSISTIPEPGTTALFVSAGALVFAVAGQRTRR